MMPINIDVAVSTVNQDVKRHRLPPISEIVAPQEPSILTAEAVANAKVFFETHFNRLLTAPSPRTVRQKEFETKLALLALPEDVQDRARQVWQRYQSDQLRQERVLKTTTNEHGSARKTSMADFEVVKILGKGSFGVVRLVKDVGLSTGHNTVSTVVHPHAASGTAAPSQLNITNPGHQGIKSLKSAMRSKLTAATKDVYAMKVIRKSTMLQNSQEGHLRAERDFLVASEGCRWVIPLLAAFQDSRHLYLVMDFCIGGDFLGLLIRKTVLSEEVTRWYLAEMILGVEEAHRMKWIHRDVKPDNFLIGADGHLKISDFGLAFDGEWSHDQSYFHKHRHDLVQKLDLKVDGDEDDQLELQHNETADRVSRLFVDKQGKAMKQVRQDEVPQEDERVLDRRNREQRRQLARSVVGTSQYMAPEVIRGDQYDGRCD